MRRILYVLLLILLPGQVWAQQTAEVQTCQNVVVEFADGFSRVPRKNQPSVEPVLVVASVQATDQTVTITLRPTAAEEIVRTIVVPAKKRTAIDLFALLGRSDADFSLEVEFQGFGVADLKMWSGGHATVSPGQTFCR